jgi:hypothetical protein
MFKRKRASSRCTSRTTAAIPAQLALLSGQVDFNFDNLATAAPNIRSGKLKAIAVTTLQRSSSLPDVPAVPTRSRASRSTPGGAWWRRPARRTTWS